MRIAINSGHGSFEFSDAACKRLMELGVKSTRYLKNPVGSQIPCRYENPKAHILRHAKNPFNGLHYTLLNAQNIAFRSDKRLIQVVEELGSDVNGGEFSNIKIVEVPDGLDIALWCFDGWEIIIEKGHVWC